MLRSIRCFESRSIGSSTCCSGSLTGNWKEFQHILVGGFNPSEKYESQLGLLFPMYGKIKAMFQTTNQYFSDWFSVIEPIAIVSFRDRPIQAGNLSCNTSVGLRSAFPKSFSL